MLEVQNLSVNYREASVLLDISFSLKSSSLVGLIGLAPMEQVKAHYSSRCSI